MMVSATGGGLAEWSAKKAGVGCSDRRAFFFSIITQIEILNRDFALLGTALGYEMLRKPDSRFREIILKRTAANFCT